MVRYALLFPGQGSQYVGMGKSLFLTPANQELFQEAQDRLKLPLLRLMFDGPVEELTKTAVAQPAILLHSLAALQFVKKETDADFSCALGHSLGEYSALVAAGVLSFGDAITLVHQRGLFMQEAVPAGAGAMAAVLGIAPEFIASALEEFSDEKSPHYVSCANFNGPEQTVIAGTTAGVAQASRKLKSLGARRVISLEVSAPFHCALMKPAQEKMAELLATVRFSNAQFPIITNVSAQGERIGDRLRALLIEQIVKPVRFTACVAHMKEQKLCDDGLLELGPKTVLCGLVKKINDQITSFHVDVAEDIALLPKG